MADKSWMKFLLDYFVKTGLPVVVEDDKVTIQGKIVHYEASDSGSFELCIKTDDGRALLLKGWHTIQRL